MSNSIRYNMKQHANNARGVSVKQLKRQCATVARQQHETRHNKRVTVFNDN